MKGMGTMHVGATAVAMAMAMAMAMVAALLLASGAAATDVHSAADAPVAGVSGYSVLTDEGDIWSDGGGSMLLARNEDSTGPYGGDVDELRVDIVYVSSTVVRVRISDPAVARWEVSDAAEVVPQEMADGSNCDCGGGRRYGVDVQRSPFGVVVTRLSDGEEVFDTRPPSGSGSGDNVFNGLIYEDQYLEWSTVLPAGGAEGPNIYGLGERKHRFRLNSTGVGGDNGGGSAETVYTLWNRDQLTPPNVNLYGSHPFHMEVRDGGASHGVLMLNSNAMDVVVAHQRLTYRLIGGVIDAYIFVGGTACDDDGDGDGCDSDGATPTPATVVADYMTLFGYPRIPAYWELGFHQCRWGYKNVDETWDVVKSYRTNELPLDAMWNDIDYMDEYLDFTTDPIDYPQSTVGDMVDDLHSHDQKYVLIVDVGIGVVPGYDAFDSGVEDNVFTMAADGETPATGSVWPGLSYFPDFTLEAAAQWWAEQLRSFHNAVAFDGIWIDMNEPSSFCNGECPDGSSDDRGVALANARPSHAHRGGDTSTTTMTYEPDYVNPPYVPGGEALNTGTIAMDSVQNASILYNTHNLYGYLEGRATRGAADDLYGKRSLVLSRSSYAGSGRYVSKWSGDNMSTYNDMYMSIPSMLTFNMLGMPLTGSDICGFMLETTEELCARWMQLGTLYSFSRNHNMQYMRAQEPYALGSNVLEVSRRALKLRYSLLPYYYRYAVLAGTHGRMIANAMLFAFPEDARTYTMDRQFMIGDGLLVCPVLDEGATDVRCFLPPTALWYSWWTGERVVGDVDDDDHAVLPAPLDGDVPLLAMGGHIVYTQAPGMTSAESHLNPWSLIVPLDADGSAYADVFIDDGESFFTVERAEYAIAVFDVADGVMSSSRGTGQPGYQPPEALVSTELDAITVLGVAAATEVTVNGRVHEAWTFDATTGVLAMEQLQLDMLIDFALAWQ